MKDKILQLCRREQLFQPGDRVICALSGGADSVAMTHCLLSLREELGITVAAAHYNHCLRGEASQGDEAFVRRLCASWGIFLTCDRGDVAGFAAETGQSIEEAARHLRYNFLLSQPGKIAVAHHADDQVETVLLNLLRGTGLRGLCAMAPKQDRIVRPLLEVTRQEIDRYLQEQNLPHREDHTNAENDALRNRLRHRVIPLLQAENPSLSRTVARMTGLLRQDEAHLEAETQRLLTGARRAGGYDCESLRAAPQVLRRRAIRQLLEIPKPAMVHVEAVEQLLTGTQGSASVNLSGGVRAVREYGLLRLEQGSAPDGFAPVQLQPGQETVLPESGMKISVSNPVILQESVDSPYTFALKYDMMKDNPGLLLRSRQPGDQLRLPGGSRSVKRLMIDRKIPAARRNLLPVLVCGGETAAVCGLGVCAPWAAVPGEQAVIIQFYRGEMRI